MTAKVATQPPPYFWVKLLEPDGTRYLGPYASLSQANYWASDPVHIDISSVVITETRAKPRD